MACQSITPYDGYVSQTFSELDDDQLDRALAAASFESWR